MISVISFWVAEKLFEKAQFQFFFFFFLRFHIVGYGCMTCIGNSGPLHEGVEPAIEKVYLLLFISIRTWLMVFVAD